MRIRTLLNCAVLAAIAMMGGLTAADVFINAKLENVSRTQGRAQATARQMAQLLVLTHEYALYSEDRAAQQWRQHQAAIVRLLENGAQDTVPVAVEAVAEAKGLSTSFQRLVEAGSTKSDVRSQQASLLLSQLLTSAQIVNDAVQHWAQDAELQRRQVEKRFHVIAIAIPMAMLSILGALAILVYRQVLRPLSTLYAAMQAVARGDLTVSSATGTDDEFGELSRTFDAMAVDLVNELRQEVQERIDAQKMEHEARQAAEASSRAKSDFLSAMSHELRTPLNAILGYAQLLRREAGLSERQATGLATIHQSGQHLLMLINDLLDLAKIEAGKFDLAPATVNLPAFLPLVADIIRVKAEEKSLLFAYEAPADLPQGVLADEKRLRQVLLNLLGNAVKFTDRGQITLRVCSLQRDAGSVTLRFEIIDSGIGMAPDQLQTIFQPFEQVGEAHRRSGGTGLGLTISRQLVQLMGSEIQVESTPGAGSRFWFDLSLPLTTASMPADAASARPISGYAGARRRLLIADDVVGNRALLADLLGGLGFEVCAAVNGAEALAQVRAQRPDLVLMDLVMPVLDGMTAIRRLRATPGLEALPIIAVSASADATECAASLTAGADAFLPKPFEQERLLERIGALLGLAWIRAEPASTPSLAAEPAEPADAADLVIPPQDEMSVLHQFALAGDMRAIRRQADRLIELDPRYQCFAGSLQRLAATYQSKAILTLVAAHLHRESGINSPSSR